jgi:2-oxoglutarate dehydrogenase complex dehydrogenase (E1) component-like enzyme
MIWSSKREESGAHDVAIVRVEQLYPFPHKAFEAEVKKYTKARTLSGVKTSHKTKVLGSSCAALYSREYERGSKTGVRRPCRVRIARLRLRPPAPRATKVFD